MPDKSVVFLVGMHRSGTSALTRLVESLGADLGKEMVPPGEDNPEGFFEHAKLVDINNRIFEALYLHWDATVQFPGNWLDNPKVKDLEQLATAWITQEFSQSPLIGLKDPRLCRTLPFWLKVMKTAERKPYFIHIFRAVGEVTSSFAARKWEASLEKAHILNALYVTEAVSATTSHPRIALDYTELLSDPEKCLKAIYSLPITWPVAKEKIDLSSIIKKQLRNQSKPLSGQKIDGELLDFSMRLEAAIEDALKQGKTPKLDAFSAEITRKIHEAERWFGFWHQDAMKAHGATMADLHKRNLQLRESESIINNYKLHTKQLEEHIEKLKQQMQQEKSLAEHERQKLIQELQQVKGQLQLILNSRGWKTLEKIRALKKKIG